MSDNIYFNILNGWTIQKRKTSTQISLITQDTIPFFEEDSFVTYCILDDTYNAATVDKDKLIIPGAGHCEAEVVDLE
ncbi:hypothetical protein ACQKML_26120 [Peribacillus frigoritolerans]